MSKPPSLLPMAQKRALAREMRERGVSPTDIATALSIGQSTAYRWTQEIEVQREEMGRVLSDGRDELTTIIERVTTRAWLAIDEATKAPGALRPRDALLIADKGATALARLRTASAHSKVADAVERVTSPDEQREKRERLARGLRKYEVG